jgi:hypothetical protein
VPTNRKTASQTGVYPAKIVMRPYDPITISRYSATLPQAASLSQAALLIRERLTLPPRGEPLAARKRSQDQDPRAWGENAHR